MLIKNLNYSNPNYHDLPTTAPDTAPETRPIVTKAKRTKNACLLLEKTQYAHKPAAPKTVQKKITVHIKVKFNISEIRRRRRK